MKFSFDPVAAIKELERHELLPAIIFRASRKDCDQDCLRFLKVKSATLSEQKQIEIVEHTEKVCEKYGFSVNTLKSLRFFEILVKFGVAPHHAGHLVSWRVVIEQLMSAGKLRAIFATSTVAAGVDFPARTVVITSHRKRGQFGVKTLTPTEFHQMAGRAGRRGKDNVGFCLFAVHPENSIKTLTLLSKAKSEPLRGAYYCAPSTILPMLKYRDMADLLELVEKGFTVFVEREEARQLLKKADELEFKLSQVSSKGSRKLKQKIAQLRKQGKALESRQMNLLVKVLGCLTELGYIKDGSLTEKGVWAAEISSSFLVEIGEILSSDSIKEVDSSFKLAALFGLIAGDETKNYLKGKLPLSSKAIQGVKSVVNKVNKLFLGLRPFSSSVLESAGYTVYRWLMLGNWREFLLELKFNNVQEGDVSRLINQTADIMLQISKLGSAIPDFAYFAEEARLMLLRPPFSEIG